MVTAAPRSAVCDLLMTEHSLQAREGAGRLMHAEFLERGLM